MEETFNRRGKSLNRNKLRNLAQYKNMEDEEFDKLMSEKEYGVEVSADFEKRISEKLSKFEEDYDISDMKINDMEALRGLMQAIISLEDYEQTLFKVRASGITAENIVMIDRIQKVMADLRKSISDYQNDLNITRRVRKSDQETSVIAYIESLKDKAKRFYESRMSYVFCPKCNTLLATIWTLYPNNDKNKLQFTCQREMPDGSICNEKVLVTTKELIDNRGTNNKEIMPESML